MEEAGGESQSHQYSLLVPDTGRIGAEKRTLPVGEQPVVPRSRSRLSEGGDLDLNR